MPPIILPGNPQGTDSYQIQGSAAYFRHMARMLSIASNYLSEASDGKQDDEMVTMYLGGTPVAAIWAQVAMSEGEVTFSPRTP